MLAFLVLGIVGYILLVHPLVVYLIDRQGLRKFPTPSFAGISSLWRVSFISRHVHFRAIYDAHLRLGTHVRIGPNHLSVSDPDAMNDIYGHGANFLKSDFYDVGAGKHRSMTDTRSKEEHNRKRKNLAHAFAQKTITGLEPVLRPLVVSLVERLDSYTHKPSSPSYSSSPQKANLRTHLYHFAVDFMSIVLFGRPLDLVSSGTDIVPALLQTDNRNTGTPEKSSSIPSYPISFLSTLHNMAQKDAIIAVEPQLQSYTSRLLAFHPGTPATRRWGDMMTYLVRRRRIEEEEDEATQTNKNDIFSKFLRNGQGKALNPEEGALIADCSIMFSAGSDGNANVLISAAYLIYKHPEVLKKLRKELDGALGGHAEVTGDEGKKIENLVPYYHQVSSLPYLRACIDESMRIRPPVTIGFPRVVPEGGRMVAGKFVEAGVVVSVPTYTLHQDPIAFKSPAEYIPERWMDLDQRTPEERKRLAAAFQPFSFGPRACIGRNISYFEQVLAVATMVSLFDFELAEGQTLDTIERLNGNPGDLFVGVRRRQGVW